MLAWVSITDMERDLEGEDVKFRQYHDVNGFDTSSFFDRADEKYNVKFR